MYVYVCVCVCVRKRERQRKRCQTNIIACVLCVFCDQTDISTMCVRSDSLCFVSVMRAILLVCVCVSVCVPVSVSAIRVTLDVFLCVC